MMITYTILGITAAAFISIALGALYEYLKPKYHKWDKDRHKLGDKAFDINKVGKIVLLLLILSPVIYFWKLAVVALAAIFLVVVFFGILVVMTGGLAFIICSPAAGLLMWYCKKVPHYNREWTNSMVWFFISILLIMTAMSASVVALDIPFTTLAGWTDESIIVIVNWLQPKLEWRQY